jgi:pimeloyl-ACP methyl ester carboxylesterase
VKIDTLAAPSCPIVASRAAPSTRGHPAGSRFEETALTTFLVIHGAWGAGWAWKKMRPLLGKRGHELFTPTQTGIGERSHLAGLDVDLDLHIADNLAVLEFEDLRDVVLVGHSYGGMVATGVADRAADRIAQLVYLDAFVPRNGQAVIDLIGETARGNVVATVRSEGEGWKVPANPMPPDTSQADLAWAVPRRVAQPQKTFLQPLRLDGAVDRLPRTYIYCTRPGPGDVFRQFADRARSEPGWACHELDASHNPHITMPETLAALFDVIATRRSV